MGRDLPPDPVTPAAAGWAVMHEMYKGMREAGFGMLEAAAIIAAMVQAGTNADPGTGEAPAA